MSYKKNSFFGTKPILFRNSITLPEMNREDIKRFQTSTIEQRKQNRKRVFAAKRSVFEGQ